MDRNRNGAAPEAMAGRREPVFNLPPIIMLLIGICVAVYLVQAYVLTREQNEILLWLGAFWPIRYSGQLPLDLYSFTSPFTYAFMHGSLTHLAINMIWLAAFGSPLANRLGNGRFLLFWAASGVAAVGLHYFVHPFDGAPVVGASGAISGMMGAAARFGFRTSRTAGKPSFDGPLLPFAEVFRSRAAMTFVAVWMVINVVTGLAGMAPGVGQIAWEAHIGGFLAGFLCIGLFVKRDGT
ncbi:MAG TPA: rhomboid family intramembrane serine protease [Rhizobiaceae bacterium]|nr:rhomboid family intramembrane serine protease [Rhizobiaceae bacterium]